MSQAVEKISTDENVIYREGFWVGFGNKFLVLMKMYWNFDVVVDFAKLAYRGLDTTIGGFAV